MTASQPPAPSLPPTPHNTPRSEVLAHEVALLAPELPSNRHHTLSLQEADGRDHYTRLDEVLIPMGQDRPTNGLTRSETPYCQACSGKFPSKFTRISPSVLLRRYFGINIT